MESLGTIYVLKIDGNWYLYYSNKKRSKRFVGHPKTINECNTLIRARGCMDFNHSCWSFGWGGMILPSLVASPLVWQNHTTPPARPAGVVEIHTTNSRSSMYCTYNHWCHTNFLYGTSGWKVIQPLVPYKKFIWQSYNHWCHINFLYGTSGCMIFNH